MNADDARRARALPIFGGAKLPPSALELDHDPNERGTLVRLLARAWPFIDRYISGRWLKIGITGRPSEVGALSETSGSFVYAPLLFTLLALWGSSHHALDVVSAAPGAAQWAQIGRWLVAVLAACAWAAWFLDRTPHQRLQTIIGVLGVLAGFLAWSCYGAIKAEGARWFTFALWLIYMAGWFIRFELQEGKLILGLRVQSHILYQFLATWAIRTTLVLIGLVTTELMFRNILLGAPLSPFLADLTGKAELARDVAQRLTGEQRLGLLTNYFLIAGAVFAANLAFVLTLLPFYSIWIQQRINQDLRLALVEHWHRLSMRYHADQRVGDSIYRIYQDSAQIVVVISRLINFVTWIYGALTALFLLCFFDARLAAMASLIIVPGLLWATYFSPRMRVKSMIARKTNSDLTSRIQEILSGLRVIKAYGREREEQQRFEADSIIAFNAAYSARSWVAVTTILTFTMTAFVLLPGEYLMAVWANQGVRVAAADLMVMIGLTYQVWSLPAFSWVKDRFFETAVDMRLISREWAVLQDTAMGLHRVFEILDIRPDVTDAPDAQPMAPFASAVEFDDVAFAYDEDRSILDGVSFTAKAGTITAIVGPTGSGKSTMMMLMLRLFDPDKGRVLIDGRDIRDLRIESLRDNISIALQENILFAMSVKDNIRYVRPATPDHVVAEAARIACADDFIAELPERYETVLGDRGGKLSTGQRQRLSIARALIKDAPILILDEPTAALDAATEHRVMRNLAAWGKGRAIFIITHRLSTIRQADQILFLHEGRICEAGHHDELMRDPAGRYRAMVRTESGETESVA